MTVNHGVPGSSPGEGAKADSPSAFFMPLPWARSLFRTEICSRNVKQILIRGAQQREQVKIIQGL